MRRVIGLRTSRRCSVSERRAERAVRLRREQPGLVRYTRPAIVPVSAQREPFHFPQGDLRPPMSRRSARLPNSCGPEPVSRRRSRDRGLYKLAAFLAEHPGATWQQRWDSSPLGWGRSPPER